MKISLFILCLMTGFASSIAEAKPDQEAFDCHNGKIETAIKKADHVLLLQFKEYISVEKQLSDTIEKTTDGVYEVLYNWTKNELPKTITVRISKKRKVGEWWPMSVKEKELKSDQILIGFLDDINEKEPPLFRLSGCIGGQLLIKNKDINNPTISEINDYFIGAKHGGK